MGGSDHPDVAEVVTDWFWETDPSHRVTTMFRPFPSDRDREFIAGLMGKACWEVSGSTPVAGPWSDLIAAMDSRRPIRGFRYRYRQGDGTDRTLAVFGEPEIDDDGTFLGYRGMSKDITLPDGIRREHDDAERLFLDAVGAVPVGVALFDPDDRLVLWNRHYATNVNPAVRLAKGMAFTDILRAALAHGLIVEARGCEEEWLRRRLASHRAPSGTVEMRLGPRFLRLNEHRTTDSHLLLIAQDVTAEKEADRELRDQKGLVEAIIENIPHAVFWKDRDSVYLGCNRNFLAHRGLSAKEQVIGKRLHDVAVAREEADRAESDDHHVIATGEARLDVEEALTRPDGSRLQVLSSKVPLRDGGGNAVGVLGIFADITERKRAETALRDSEAFLRAITGSVADGIVMVDEKGRIAFWNDAAERMFGYTAAEARGKPVHDLLAPQRYREAAECGHRHFVETGEGPIFDRTVSLHGRRRDGSEFPLDLSVARLERKEGRHAVAVVRDMTERQEAERQVRQAQRIRALGNLAGGVAHELNNLLLPILTLSQMTMKALPGDSRERRKLERVVEASERARDLVAKIMDFSRQGETVTEEVDLYDAVAKALSFLETVLPSTVTVRSRLDPATGRIDGHREHIQTLLANLASNAVDAFEGCPGTIVVSLAPLVVTAEQAAGVADLRTGRYARLTVADAGKGMDAETLDRAFEPFFTTKEVGAGAGLGLAVVHGIVERHGGAIHVASEVGKGTTVDVYLPLRPDDNRSVRNDGQAAVDAAGSG